MNDKVAIIIGNRKLIGKLISVEAKWINRFYTQW